MSNVLKLYKRICTYTLINPCKYRLPAPDALKHTFYATDACDLCISSAWMTHILKKNKRKNKVVSWNPLQTCEFSKASTFEKNFSPLDKSRMGSGIPRLRIVMFFVYFFFVCLFVFGFLGYFFPVKRNKVGKYFKSFAFVLWYRGWLTDDIDCVSGTLWLLWEKWTKEERR